VQYASKALLVEHLRRLFVHHLQGPLFNLVALISLSPRLSSFFGIRMSLSGKDCAMAQGSAWFLAAGAFIMAVTASPVFFIIGVGGLARFGVRVLLGRPQSGAYVSACTSKIGMMSTLLRLAQSAGTMIADPALALSFKRGMKLGGFWFGLPYVNAAGLFFCAAILSFGLSVNGQGVDSGDPARGPGAYRVQQV
jgi:hypothetical protein